jgi:hypothetical protein
VIDWHAAERLVGEVVTVEGDVVVARNLGDTCTLEFSADDPRAFRIVLVLPLITDLPRQPDRLYQGRRVRATGRVQRFQGRAEMLVRSPTQIEVVGVETGGPTVPPPAAPASSPPAPAPVAPPPAAPRGLVEEVRNRLVPPEACGQAQARWRDAAATVRTRISVLDACLAAATYRCHPDAAALGPALSALEWAGQQTAEACRER